ncbi:MAG: AAA family ATPase [Campylobacterota bacterium]|nr:AAA family ATPase [Campylobacterota bacterium]
MIYKFKTEGAGIGFDFDVEFEQNNKINCIIGKNGIGKTQLLENMAKSLIYTHSIFLKDGAYKYKNLFSQKKIKDKIENLELKLPMDLTLNNTKIKDKNKQKWGHTKLDLISSNRDKSFICDKPIVFIGAKNRGFTNNIDPDNIKILGSSQARLVESIRRTMSYINGIGLEQEEIANWFVSRLIVNPNFVYAEQNKTNEVIAVLRLIEKLEPSMKLVKVNENGSNSLSMLYHEGQLLINNIPIDKLSTGFVSIVKIFQEIVAGYGGWENTDDLSQVDGVVFIDEIEPHLHISWQTKIINILKEFFPKTTFYITTHSPLVLAGLKDNEAYELYNEDNIVKTKKIENIENYFLNDIIKEFFDVDLNKEKIDNPNKEKQKKARKLLLNLTKSLDEDK